MANTTFKMNGWIYTYNEPMTSNWGWPEGKKGERTRILKKQMLQLLKERDAFNTPFEEVDEPAETAAEAPSSPTETDNEPVEEQERAQIESATETAETDESAEDPVKVSIPTEMYTGKSLRNLINLVYTRAGLINKALGTRLSVDQGFIETINGIAADEDIKKAIEGNESAMVGLQITADRITFSTLPEDYTVDAFRAFVELISGMNKQALTQKRIQAKKVNEENEKYAMRIWLTRLGMNGPDYKETRRILMQNLSGHAAFRTEAERQRWTEKHTAKKEGKA